MQTSKCKGCGREIVFARSPNNKHIPLDLSVVVYKVGDNGDAYPMPKGQYLISHFITCRNRDDFSSSNKKNFNPGGTE